MKKTGVANGAKIESRGCQYQSQVVGSMRREEKFRIMGQGTLLDGSPEVLELWPPSCL
jgi:hypothetical protein